MPASSSLKESLSLSGEKLQLFSNDGHSTDSQQQQLIPALRLPQSAQEGLHQGQKVANILKHHLHKE